MMSSGDPATSPISWVMKIIYHAEIFAVPAEQRTMICACHRRARSRQLVGDQQPQVAGSTIAIITRCRMPPDSWCG